MKMKIKGIWTFSLHPNVMTEENFKATENFIRIHKSEFISFDDLKLTDLKGKDCFSRFFCIYILLNEN